MTSPAEILSQDEVDKLLKGVNGDAAPEAAAEEAASADGVRRYDLANPERIARGRLPTLEIINDRFSRLARPSLYNLLRRTPDITTEPAKVGKFDEFMRNLVVPTNLNVVQLKPLRGQGLLVIEPALVMAFVETLFGGDGRFHVRIEGRDFTPTEQRIIERVLALLIADYNNAWSSVFPLNVEYVRSEMNPHFARIASPGEPVVTSSFSVELGPFGGKIHMCMPYSSLEPLRETLASLRPGVEAETDQRWLKGLTGQLQSAAVNVSAPLAHRTMSLGDVALLKAGDFIPLDIAELVTADVQGVPLFECRYGASNGRYALRVERVLQDALDAINATK